MMHASTTVLTVRDVVQSMAYYRDKLGAVRAVSCFRFEIYSEAKSQ